MISLVRTVAPTVEPVDLPTAKAHCRVGDSNDDSLLILYIQAAREHAENFLNRPLLQQTFRFSRDSFSAAAGPGHRFGWYVNPADRLAWSMACLRPTPLLLPKPPVINVSSVTYLDTSGVRQTLDPTLYAVNYDAEPCTVTPAPGTYWPATIWNRSDAVQVTFTAGYGTTPLAVPAGIQLAILGLVAHWYENRESFLVTDGRATVAQIPQFVDSLLQDHQAPTTFTYEV